MKALKIILLIVALLLIACAVLYISSPSEVHVERTIVIAAAPSSVFEEVNNLKNWNNWDPWYKLDSTMKQEYEGPDEGVGMIRRWESENSKVGEGEMEIIESKDNEYIKNELRFGHDDVGYGSWTFEVIEEGTKVTWAMDAIPNDIYFKIMSHFMDGMMGPMFEEGLTDLKTLVENKPVVSEYDISTIDLVPTWYLTIKGTTPSSQIGMKLGELFGQLVTYAQQQSLEFVGQPIAFYYDYDPDGLTSLEAGVPISDSTTVTDNIELKKLEGQALQIKYFGKYGGTEAAYQALEDHIKTNGLEQSGAPWEQYITDPSTEPDTLKWETHIYFPI